MDILEIIAKVLPIYIPFLFSLCIHEYAHGWVAKKLGDNTASTMGRLTLNPVAHADPVGTVVLPVAGIIMNVGFFGWAKPVPVNERNLKHPKKDMFWISAAGPGINIILGAIAAFVWAFSFRFISDPGQQKFMMSFSQNFVSTNMMLAVFNLIPIPPLDGAKVLGRFLPDSINDQLEANAMMLSMIFFILIMTGALSILQTPIYMSTMFLIKFAASVVS